MKILQLLDTLCRGAALIEYRATFLELIDEEHSKGGNCFSQGSEPMDREVKANIRSVYDQYAKMRNDAERPAWKNAEREYALRAFRDNGGGSLLEIGAGTGQDSLFFKDNGLEVYALDLSEEHVKCCTEKGLSAAAMDLHNMAFKPDLFDCIYSINCFLHIPKNTLGSALRETKRVLRQSGLFYLGVYGGRDFEGYLRWKDYYDAERFFAFYEFSDYQRILEEYFSIVQAREIRLSDDLEFNAFLLTK